MTLLSLLGAWIGLSVPVALAVGAVLAGNGKEAHAAPTPVPARTRRAA